MARAAVQALPLDLDRACRAIGLPFQKDREGHRLMLRMCKPRARRKGEDPNRVYWHFDGAKLERLLEYCVADVRAEIGLDHALRPLQDQERPVWLLDQVMNNRGVEIDTEFVKTAKAFVARAVQRANDRMAEVTAGAVTAVTQVDRLKNFAKSHGVEFKTVEKTRRNGDEYEAKAADKEALQDLLAGPLPEPVKHAFELRLEAGKSSLKKLDKFITQAPHGRARGNLQYHAAAPGRWAGRGIQLQNLVRRGVDEPGGWDQAYRDMRDLDDDTFEMVWGSPFDVVSRMMRGAVIAKEGHKLYFADFASVEARGCVWAAGQTDKVELFARDGKIYEETAAQIFDIPVEDVNKDQRFLGKGTVLGCGYGMGALKFQATCKKQGKPIPFDLAQTAVGGWREANPRVVTYWGELEDAAKHAIEAPEKVSSAGPFSYRVKGKWLQCRLPSGRVIWYRRPGLKWVEKEVTKSDGTKTTRRDLKIHYWGVNGITKQWEEETTWGGKLLENCDQGMCSDFLRGALLRLEAAQYWPILSVHDEPISEVPEGFGSVAEYVRVVSEVPQWAPGFPLRAEGGSGTRYAKA
jgi:DNA polymerase